ncbi:MAG TPA: alpha/beta hydrolase [Patescibacteria group bacterium]
MVITAKGVKTHYQQIGSSQQVIVLLHGWGCDWQIWAPLIPELSKKFQLVIPDLPAFGHSDTPTEVWDSHGYVEWLREFIAAAVGQEKFSLVGHSFGGKVAALLAAEEEKKHSGLSKMVIIDASGLPVDLTPKEQVVHTLSQLLPAFIKRQMSKKMKTSLLQKTGVAVDYQQANEYQQAVLKRIVRENISQTLKKIKVPTLVIWGANDQATPLTKGREFAAAIPGANLEIMTHSGHYPFLDETEKSINLLTTFL